MSNTFRRDVIAENNDAQAERDAFNASVARLNASRNGDQAAPEAKAENLDDADVEHAAFLRSVDQLNASRKRS